MAIWKLLRQLLGLGPSLRFVGMESKWRLAGTHGAGSWMLVGSVCEQTLPLLLSRV